MSEAQLADRLLAPLDGVRRLAFEGARRVPGLAPWLLRRDRRLAAQSSLGVALLFAVTLAAPGALYVIGPAIFGVAHVASDVRYLVLRRDVPRPWVSLAIVASLLMVLVRAAPFFGLGHALLPRAEVTIGWGWAIVGALYGAHVGGRPWRALALAAPLLVIVAAAWQAPGRATLLFAYAHNLIALVLWVLLFRRRRAFALPALALAALGASLLASGAAFAPASLAAPSPLGAWAARLFDDARMTLPALTEPRAIGVALSYVFLQALHYSVWLAWVPQDDARGEGTLSFRMSFRSLARDFGPAGLALVAALALVVAGASLFSPHQTRALYLSLATFHGYLEVSALAFFLARGSHPAASALARRRQSAA
ncbi:MAG: hypothetical protein MUF34_05485 [Polyangiaceae bacterium]|nr:hypothetical protein [Polyangiaceae bacterium]